MREEINMNIKVNDILVFNKKEYLVLEVIDNRYLYLINNDTYENDTAIVKIVEKYGKQVELFPREKLDSVELLENEFGID